jgi:hypothetical protein
MKSHFKHKAMKVFNHDSIALKDKNAAEINFFLIAFHRSLAFHFKSFPFKPFIFSFSRHEQIPIHIAAFLISIVNRK